MTKTTGHILKKFRERFGFSQSEIAENLGINRVVLANIEADKRKLKKTEELTIKIADFFEIELEELFDSPMDKILKINSDDDFYKFKNTILYILSKCGHKPNIGKTFLNKLLYFSDFNYYEFEYQSITGQTYYKLPRGPVPNHIDTVLDQMQENKQIQKITTEFGNYKQIKFFPNIDYDLDGFTAKEIKIIDQVIDKFSNMTATQISDYSHEDIPYKATRKLKDEISYQLAMYRQGDYIANPENDD